jgi:hypothetical protein
MRKNILKNRYNVEHINKIFKNLLEYLKEKIIKLLHIYIIYILQQLYIFIILSKYFFYI